MPDEQVVPCTRCGVSGNHGLVDCVARLKAVADNVHGLRSLLLQHEQKIRSLSQENAQLQAKLHSVQGTLDSVRGTFKELMR